MIDKQIKCILMGNGEWIYIILHFSIWKWMQCKFDVLLFVRFMKNGL